jgi:DNA-binding transcriptional LysR family regulator
MLDPRRVLTFREVARLGSFSRAADALALTQPAVSQQVSALERQAGVRLLERGPGGLSLTDAGALLLEHADVVAARLGSAQGQLAELAEHARRHLRVGSFPSAVATIVPAAIARLDRSTKVELVEASQEELAAGVAAGEVHAAVSFQDAALPRREPEGTAREDLHREPFMALLARDHPLARKGPIRLADLAHETWVAPSREGLIVRACEKAGFTPAIRYVSSDPLANRGLVVNGLAVTISPQRLTEALHGIAVEAVADAPARDVYALLPAAGATPLAWAFVEALASA